MPDELEKRAQKLDQRSEDLVIETRELAGDVRGLAIAARRRTRALISVLMLIALALVVLSIGVLQSRDISKGNHALLAVFADALDQKGCLSRLGTYQRARDKWELEAFIADLHHVKEPTPPKRPAKCTVPSLPRSAKPVPLPTVTRTRFLPGPVRTVILTRCVRPSGRPC